MTNDRTDLPEEAQPRPPTNGDPDAWRAYWQTLGRPWRTEPEIDDKRKEELARRRAIMPDLDQGEPAFSAMVLSRGDVEWLLETHDDGRGPADWYWDSMGPSFPV